MQKEGDPRHLPLSRYTASLASLELQYWDVSRILADLFLPNPELDAPSLPPSLPPSLSLSRFLSFFFLSVSLSLSLSFLALSLSLSLSLSISLSLSLSFFDRRSGTAMPEADPKPINPQALNPMKRPDFPIAQASFYTSDKPDCPCLA